MKFSDLKSVAHNIADSFASGIGLMIGPYITDVFAEAGASSEGYILVDFLSGTSSGAKVSTNLEKAISLYSEALSDLCQRHGFSVDAFCELSVRFFSDSFGRRFVVTIQDKKGRRSIDEYIGSPGRRVKELDGLGRIRPKRRSVSKV